MPILTIQLLGNFCLTYDEKPITAISQIRQQSLLAYLLLHRHTPQSRQHLAFLFWPDSNEVQAKTNLRKVLHQFRQALPDADRFLYSDSKTLQWIVDAPFTLDVATFANRIAQANAAEQSGRLTEVAALLADAVECYKGELLPNCYDDWVLRERERLHQQCIKTMEQLMLRLEEQRDYGSAIHYGHHLLQLDPLHENTYRRLMRLYALNGDRASALRIYHTCATTLAQELEIEPSPDTQEAHAHLLKLDVPHAGTLPQLVNRTRLVGRHVEWAKLQSVWRLASGGYAHFALVSGEAGIGKTLLTEEMFRWATQQGIATAHARVYANEGQLAYAPVVEWLRSLALQTVWKTLDAIWLTELSRLLPELLIEHPHLSRPTPFTERWQRQHIFEALARAIQTVKSPLLLALDDLQWCDIETLEWLHYLLRFDAKARLLIVGTMRPEEVTDSHPLTSLLLNLRSVGQMTEIELGPLTMDETAALANQVVGHKLAADAVQRLYQETEGNPLFVVETTRATAGAMSANSNDIVFGPTLPAIDPNFSMLPSKIYAILQRRLVQLSPAAHELASLAAVIGRSFTFQVLAQASDFSEDALVRGLDELWQRRIIREQRANTYDFSHDRIREVAYAALSPVRRRSLNRRVAQALESIYANNLDRVCGQLAIHYEQAGMPEQAIVYYQQSAQIMIKIHASKSALSSLEKAVALLQTLPDSKQRVSQEMELQLGIGFAIMLEGAFASDRAIVAFERSLELSRTLQNAEQMVSVLSGLWLSHFSRGNLLRAREIAQQLLTETKHQPEHPAFLMALFALSDILLFEGIFVTSLELAMQVVAAYDLQRHREMNRIYGYDPGLCVIPIAAQLSWLLGHIEQSSALIQRAIALVDDQIHPPMFAYVKCMAAVLYCWRGEVNEVLEHSNAAIKVSEEKEYTQWLIHALILRGWAMTQQGQVEGITQLQKAILDWQNVGANYALSFYRVLLAEAYAQFDLTAEGLDVLANAKVEANVIGEHWMEAELYRLRGELLWQQDAPDDKVEACFYTAIDIARQQKAKSLELRAVMSLCRLWMKQGKHVEALSLLTEVYNWFTEGFDTIDLQTAKALLIELQIAR